MKAIYVNPFTDFGFKKIFAEEASKPILIDFLNSLLPNIKIKQIEFKDKEKLGKTAEQRKAVYDIYCQTEHNERIIVELQKAKQNYFKDRTIYYASFPIQEQAQKGEWDYSLKAVYCVGILDFKFDEDKISKGEVIHTVELKDQHNQVFYDKLQFIYLEMPNFNKTLESLLTRLDKWLYFIKHLEDFDDIPIIFQDDVFVQAFEKAELAKYSQREKDEYEASLKIYRDLKGVIDTAYEEGKQEGIMEGRIEGKQEGRLEGILEGKIAVAQSLKENGVDVSIIIKTTGLTKEQIDKL